MRGSSLWNITLISFRPKYLAASSSELKVNSTTRCGDAEKALSNDASRFSSPGAWRVSAIDRTHSRYLRFSPNG